MIEKGQRYFVVKHHMTLKVTTDNLTKDALHTCRTHHTDLFLWSM